MELRSTMSSASSYIPVLLDGFRFTGKSTFSFASEVGDWSVYVKMHSAPLQIGAVEDGAR